MKGNINTTNQPKMPSQIVKKIQIGFSFIPESGKLFFGMTHGSAPSVKTGRMKFLQANNLKRNAKDTTHDYLVDETIIATSEEDFKNQLELTYLKLLQKIGIYLLGQADLANESRGELPGKEEILKHLDHIGKVLPQGIVKNVQYYGDCNIGYSGECQYPGFLKAKTFKETIKRFLKKLKDNDVDSYFFSANEEIVQGAYGALGYLRYEGRNFFNTDEWTEGKIDPQVNLTNKAGKIVPPLSLEEEKRRILPHNFNSQVSPHLAPMVEYREVSAESTAEEKKDEEKEDIEPPVFVMKVSLSRRDIQEEIGASVHKGVRFEQVRPSSFHPQREEASSQHSSPMANALESQDKSSQGSSPNVQSLSVRESQESTQPPMPIETIERNEDEEEARDIVPDMPQSHAHIEEQQTKNSSQSSWKIIYGLCCSSTDSLDAVDTSAHRQVGNGRPGENDGNSVSTGKRTLQTADTGESEQKNKRPAISQNEQPLSDLPGIRVKPTTVRSLQGQNPQTFLGGNNNNTQRHKRDSNQKPSSSSKIHPE